MGQLAGSGGWGGGGADRLVGHTAGRCDPGRSGGWGGGGQTGSEIDEWVTLLAAVTRVGPADGVGGGQTGSEIDEWVTLLAAVTRVGPAGGGGGRLGRRSMSGSHCWPL